MTKNKIKPISLITCGGGDEKSLNIILSLTSIRSEVMINAVRYYHVRGLGEKELNAFGYDIPNFRRTLKTVETVARKMEDYLELRWSRNSDEQ